MKRWILISAALCAAAAAWATTWFEGEETDPISGEPTPVMNIGSYGGYIYDRPSKYDGVYWPLTEETHLRFNETSGYIAFGSDFQNLETNKIERVRAFLKTNYDPASKPQTHLEKLRWAEKVYKARKADETFFIRHHCLLSHLTRNDEQAANPHRKEALKRIDAHLKTAPPSFYRSQLYLVAGFYSKLLGDDEKAEAYWASPDRLKFDAETTREAKDYLEEILASIKSGEFRASYFE